MYANYNGNPSPDYSPIENEKEELDDRCSTPLSVHISEDVDSKIKVGPGVNIDKLDKIENSSPIAQ